MRYLILIPLAILLSFTVSLSSPNQAADCARGNEPAASQSKYAKTYSLSERDYLSDLKIANNGDFIVSGSTLKGTHYDWWVLRIGTDGNILWEKSIDWGVMDAMAGDIVETSDGGLVVIGTSERALGRELIVLKLTGDGEFVWQTTFLGERGFQSIAATQDGGVLISGYIYEGEFLGWFLKLNSAGMLVWEKKLYHADQPEIIETSDGNIILAGRTYVDWQNVDTWVSKLSPEGTLIWQNRYGGTSFDAMSKIIETNDHGYLIGGYTESFGRGSLDGWILKLDTDGNIIWQKAYGEIGWDIINSVAETGNGEFLVAGVSTSYGNGEYSLWLMKLTSLGEIIWQKNYSVGEPEIILENPDGGIIVGGNTNFASGPNQLLIVKLDSEGEIGRLCPSLSGRADVTITSASVIVTDYALLNPGSQTVTVDYTIHDTSARSFQICLQRYYLPYIQVIENRSK